MSSFNIKSVFLSAAYVIALIVVLFILNVGLEILINKALIPLFDWFNIKKLWFKILFILIGGVAGLYLIFTIANMAGAIINGLILSWFPVNVFNITVSMILAMANAIYSIVVLWKHPEHYNFWIVIELLLVSVFIWSINFIVVMRKEK